MLELPNGILNNLPCGEENNPCEVSETEKEAVKEQLRDIYIFIPLCVGRSDSYRVATPGEGESTWISVGTESGP